MKKNTLLFIGLLIVTVGCRPASTPLLPTSVPLPTATVLPPTAILPATLTMTIKENECTLDGPTTIPYVVLTINLIMDEQKPTESGHALIYNSERG